MTPPGWNPAAVIILRVLQTGRKSRAAGFAIKRHGILKPYMAKGNTSNGQTAGYWFYVPIMDLSRHKAWADLSSADRLVYMVLCSFGGQAHKLPDKPIPIRWIAERAACTRRTVITAIANLKAAGFITASGRHRSANIYTFSENWSKTSSSGEKLSPVNGQSGENPSPVTRQHEIDLVKTLHMPGENPSPVLVKTLHTTREVKRNTSKLTTRSLIAAWVDMDKSKGGLGKVSGQAAQRAKDLWDIALSVNSKDPDKAIDWWGRVLESAFSQKAWPFNQGLGSCGLITIHKHLQTAIDGIPKKPKRAPDHIRRDPVEYGKWKTRQNL